MVDQSQMYRNDGSYDFKKREDWDYKHSYNFMAGWLGQEEADKERKRKKKLGTVDLPAPPIPDDTALVENIEKTAKHVQQNKDPEVFERLVQDRNKNKPGWDFFTEGKPGYDYYKFCRHCAERQVNPRPLAEQAKKVKQDRDLKQANVKANVFAAGTGEKLPVKEAVFKVGELMEVLGVKSKPDYNGKIVRVLKYHPEADRYEVKFEGGRYDTVVVKLKEENLMYSAVEERQMKDEKEEMPEGELPNGTRVEIRGLQSDASKWMNGQKAIIVQWDRDADRYEVRMEVNNDIKKVKPANVRPELPEGWEEHYDEHLGRSYYLNVQTQKVTWRHPNVANQRGKMGQVRENHYEDLQDVEIDVDRKHYEVDEQEEMEGSFNLHELIKKVEEREEKRAAAEEAGLDDIDSDDGMHSVAKKKKKKKQKKDEVTAEKVEAKAHRLVEHTMVARVTMKKDYSLLEGNFVARDLDPLIQRLEASPEPSETLLREVFEVTLALLEKAAQLLGKLSRSKLQLLEVNKIIDHIVTLTTPQELLEDAKWVASFLKTM